MDSLTASGMNMRRLTLTRLAGGPQKVIREHWSSRNLTRRSLAKLLACLPNLVPI